MQPGKVGGSATSWVLLLGGNALRAKASIPGKAGSLLIGMETVRLEQTWGLAVYMPVSYTSIFLILPLSKPGVAQERIMPLGFRGPGSR